MKPYRIEYGNDTGPHDNYFVEFWDVTNDEKSFRCESEEESNYLLKILESHTELLEALTNLYNAIGSCVDLTPDLLQKSSLAIKKATT